MADDISTIYTNLLINGLDMLSQQKDTRLAQYARIENGKSKKFYVDAIGQAGSQEIVDRNGDTPNNDISHQRTWITLKGRDSGHMVDNIDVLKTLHEPTNGYTKAIDAEMRRQKDKVMINAFFADAIRDEEGGTTVSFPAANVVAVDSWAYGSGSGNAGLTVSKVLEGREKLGTAEVDLDAETPILAVTWKQVSRMLSTTELTSSDFADFKRLEKGNITEALGCIWVKSQQLLLDGSGYVRVPMWVPSGMCMGIGADIDSWVMRRPDKKGNWQIYSKMFMGAARIDDTKVIEIKCTV